MCKLLCKWTVLGFLTVLLFGPLMGLLATVLPFALLGFAIWAPVHILMHGRRSPAWQILARTRAVGERAAAAVRYCGGPLRLFALEVLSGAALGALLVLLTATDASPKGPEIAAGLGLGAAVGFLVVLAGLKARHQAALGYTAEESGT
jgi:hypothetical protein